MRFKARSNARKAKDASAAAAHFPRRPSSGILSESIPLFFIGRNTVGFWVAREALGRTGGVFLFRQSALRFASKYSAPAGCATMSLSERLELDVENRGNLIASWLVRVLSRLSNLIPTYPPPIAIGRRNLKKAGWQ